jgi:hypothetical protein
MKEKNVRNLNNFNKIKITAADNQNNYGTANHGVTGGIT